MKNKDIVAMNNIISDVIKCAAIYDNELNNRNLLFIVQNGKSIECLETSFEAERFQHLTGLSYKNKTGGIDSYAFYKLCINKELKQSDITINSKKTINQVKDKLIALQQTAAIHKTARMIGDYNNNGIALKTDKLAGNVSVCMGFIPHGRFYIPNTNIYEDIRKKIDYQMPVLVILRKDIKDEKYDEITHIKKGLDLSTFKIPPNIKKLMSIKAMNDLKIDFEDTVKLEDFEISRILNDEDKLYYAEVSINGESKKYEILHGEDNESINKLCEDFGISIKLARKVLEKADEMDVIHKEVMQETSVDDEYAPNKDPPEHVDELDIIE